LIENLPPRIASTDSSSDDLAGLWVFRINVEYHRLLFERFCAGKQSSMEP